MSEWSEKVQELRDRYKGDRWNLYSPLAKRGFGWLSLNENLACVFCESLVEVKSDNIPEADGSVVIACDHDISGGYKRVTLLPDSKVEGGAVILPTSLRSCSRGLIKGQI